MIKNNIKGKKYIEITAAVLASACLFIACSNKPDLPTASHSYGPELGLASGNVDLSSDSPDINISDIKSPVGENIDFLSGVTVMNEDAYEDLEIWADASTIDIFTPGDYTVVYTFNYGGNTISKDVKVTIFEPEENEPELSDTIAESSDSNDTNETETHSSKPTSTTKNEVSSNDKATSTQETTSKSNTGNSTEPTTSTTKPTPEQSTKPTTTTKPISTTKPTGTTKPTSGQTTTKKENTTREIITTKGNQTTANKHIANYTIELLSGKTITIKNTTSKYIVSTRTDTSIVTKNGSKYKVSKLIIRYNTGAEQILEVVEEKIG